MFTRFLAVAEKRNRAGSPLSLPKTLFKLTRGLRRNQNIIAPNTALRVPPTAILARLGLALIYRFAPRRGRYPPPRSWQPQSPPPERAHDTRAAFDYAHELLGVKSPSEFIELSTAQMRKQFDMFSAQNKELCALAQEVATEAAEPIKTGVSEAFNTAH